MAVALEPHPKEATSGLCFQRLTCNFAQVNQLASPMLPARGPLKQLPAISHSTRDSVIAMIRRRVNGPPIFERPSQTWPTSISGFLLTAGMCVSLIAVAVCRIDRITLDRFIDLMPMHGHITRGSNADPNLLAFNASDSDADAVTDVDLLVYGSSEN